MKAIYLIQATNGLTKIGIAASPKKRLCALRADSPLPLDLIHMSLVDNALEVEHKLHAEFADKWSHGEWFRLAGEDIDSIRNRYPATDIPRSGGKRLVLLGLTPSDYRELRKAADFLRIPLTQFLVNNALAAAENILANPSCGLDVD